MNEEPGIDPKTDIPEPDPNYDKAFAESIAEESSEIRSSMEQDPRFKLIALSKTVSRIRYGLGSISFVGGVALIFLTLYHANVGLQEAIKLIVDNGLGETVPWVLVAKAFVYATSLTMGVQLMKLADNFVYPVGMGRDNDIPQFRPKKGATRESKPSERSNPPPRNPLNTIGLPSK